MNELLKSGIGIILIFTAILLPAIDLSIIDFSTIDRITLLGLQVILTFTGMGMVYIDE